MVKPYTIFGEGCGHFILFPFLSICQMLSNGHPVNQGDVTLINLKVDSPSPLAKYSPMPLIAYGYNFRANITI